MSHSDFSKRAADRSIGRRKFRFSAAASLAFLALAPMTVLGGEEITCTDDNIGDLKNGVWLNDIKFDGVLLPGPKQNNVVAVHDILNTASKPKLIFGGYAYGEAETSTVSGNTVTISDVSVSASNNNADCSVHGGYVFHCDKGESVGNSILLEGVNKLTDIYGGYADNNVESSGVSRNSISASVVGGSCRNIFGGYHGNIPANGASRDNTVDFRASGGTVVTEIYGGRAFSLADGNSVSIEFKENSRAATGIYGGWADTNSGRAENNSVSVRITDGSSLPTGIIRGGSASRVVNNKLSLYGCNHTASLHGGFGKIAENNSLTVDGCTSGSWIYGGYYGSSSTTFTTDNAVMRNNSVFVNRSNYTGGTIVGGGAFNNNRNRVEKNSVVISNNSSVASVWCGYIEHRERTTVLFEGICSGNRISFDGSSASGDIYAAHCIINRVANYGVTSNNNEVSLVGSRLNTGVYCAGVYGHTGCPGTTQVNGNHLFADSCFIAGTARCGRGQATDTCVVNDNVLSANNSIIGGEIFGAEITNAKFATIVNNTVSIKGSFIYGHTHAASCNISANGAAEIRGNRMFISDCKLESGNSDQRNHVASRNNGNAASVAVLSDNSVSIRNTAIRGNVYGAYNTGSIQEGTRLSGNKVSISGNSVVQGSVYGGWHNANTPAVLIVNNSISVTGGIINGSLYGGSKTSGVTENISGNKLEICNRQHLVNGIFNFDHYTLRLPSDMKNGETLIKIINPVANSNLVLKNKEVCVDLGKAALSPGDKVILINAAMAPNGIDNGADASEGYRLFKLPSPESISCDYDTAIENNMLTLTVTSLRISPKLKALAEGHLVGSIAANQAADLAIGNGMGEAISEAATTPAIAPFGATSYGLCRYRTGSAVNTNGISGIVGLAKRFGLKENRLTAAAFFEFGFGSYDCENDFAEEGKVKSKGGMRYFGAGLMERFEFDKCSDGNFYLEGSERFGRIKTDFKSADLLNSDGKSISYDSGSAYLGAHLGGGYTATVNETTKADVCCRCLWTFQNSDSLKAIDRRSVDFSKVNCFRLQVGLQGSYKIDDAFRFNAGGIWEYGLGGRAGSSIEGAKIPVPTLKGSTFRVETGASFNRDGLTVSIGLDGSLGARNCVQLSLQVLYCL
ncbi:MAG: hypothetical protein LBO73_00425 [Holosporaceae bacterium]|jgi:hypothetical protein|nr:hypothetical protein [Holosporaceae bacterium]